VAAVAAAAAMEGEAAVVVGAVQAAGVVASATLSGLCTSRIRHKNRGQQCVCDTIVLHAVRRRSLALSGNDLDGSIPTSMGLLTNLV
jgi:hypothetical protein